MGLRLFCLVVESCTQPTEVFLHEIKIRSQGFDYKKPAPAGKYNLALECLRVSEILGLRKGDTALLHTEYIRENSGEHFDPQVVGTFPWIVG